MTIHRYSSRRGNLQHAFLADKLRQAKSYKRIAGYFRSSIFELVGEEISHIPVVKIVCNSDLDISDIAVSKAVRDSALKERWNAVPVEIESILHRERYQRLYELLSQGNVEIRVVPRTKVFVHGKAGVIATETGKTCFLGSINESRNAFSVNYEILWEDSSAEGVSWVEEEFDALWQDSYPLPDAIVEEIRRVSRRNQVSFREVIPKDLPGATFAEAPIYRNGEILTPWQRSFVTTFMEHREQYGRARLLLADEVGLGKTLSLGASAMMGALLQDGPVLILCPRTLVFQWQTELQDKLGVPSAVWISNQKVWADPDGNIIKAQGAEDVARCPYQVAIVSTGMIFHDTRERSVLLNQKFGTVVLDEAHKARRRGGLGRDKNEPNNLLDFMHQIGMRTKNLLLGTGTPIQTDVSELWDLMGILNAGCDFVLGGRHGQWHSLENVLPLVKGDRGPTDEREAWTLLRNPLPPKTEESKVALLRWNIDVGDDQFISDVAFGDLSYAAQECVRQTLDSDFFKRYNPIVRHTVLRRRDTLEQRGLLDRVGVNIHPNTDADSSYYLGLNFINQGLMTNHPFDVAYEAVEEFIRLFQKRVKGTGFMKTLLLQRICSSFASGRITAGKFLNREPLDDEEEVSRMGEALANLTEDEQACLHQVVSELSRPEARDPKLSAVKYFLNDHRIEGKTWLEHGCIIFSQYYDTALWIASELAKTLPDEVVAVYAGLGKSGLYRADAFSTVGREDIKAAVKSREIRLVVATDAACEGLNLQTLGTLINIDLPWNPSRLEQRLGRIKRFGQTRTVVDMLNLVYHGTQDQVIYQALSRRLKDKHDIFGGLPDTIEDEWIDDAASLEDEIDKYIHLRVEARNAFDIRYESSIEPDKNRWELCERVLSRTDIIARLSQPW